MLLVAFLGENMLIIQHIEKHYGNILKNLLNKESPAAFFRPLSGLSGILSNIVYYLLTHQH